MLEVGDSLVNWIGGAAPATREWGLWAKIDAGLWIALAGLAAMLAGGVYLISRVRRMREEEDSSTHTVLTNVREAHARGELSDEEYRTIKSHLTARLRDELEGSKKKD